MIRQSTELLSGPSEKRSKPTNGHTEEIFGQAMELDDPVGNGDDWDRMDTEEIDNGIRYQQLTEETLSYATELKVEYRDDQSKEVKDTLQSIFSMFAYQDPRKSPIAHILENSGRVRVAEELNSAILGTFAILIVAKLAYIYVVSLGKSSAAALERLCQQTEVLLGEISEHGGAGAFVNMNHDFLR